MADIRFGVQWAPALNGEDLTGLCRKLDSLGFYSVGFPDHFFFGSAPDHSSLHAPFAALGYAAAVTSRIRLVSIVADNDFHHPGDFARNIATLDILSGGRAEAGIGAGWYEPEYKAMGIPFDSGSVRVARLDEAVTVIKSLWTEAATDFSGEFYRLEGAPGLPKPVQRPHPPLLVGAGGPKMLALAGRHADIVGITTSVRDLNDRDAMRAQMRHEVVARKVDKVKEAASASGRDPSAIVFQAQIDMVEWEGEDPGHLWALIGEPEAMADELRRRADMGITYFMFRERRVDRLQEFAERVFPLL